MNFSIQIMPQQMKWSNSPNRYYPSIFWHHWRKTVFLIDDKTTFQLTVWAPKGTKVIHPNSKESGIMISHFICDQGGYFALTDEEYEKMKQSNPQSKSMPCRHWLEYGKEWEGYWTSEKFMKQIKEAAKTVNFKLPKDSGWKVVWIFDHSSCHSAMPEDAFVVPKMSVNPGGKQPVARDG